MRADRVQWMDAGRRWAPELLLGSIISIVGLIEVASKTTYYGGRLPLLMLITGVAAASMTVRRAPAVGLVMVWALLAFQVTYDLPVLWTQGAVAIVAFGCTRWGNPATIIASGLSIPMAAVISLVLMSEGKLDAIFYDPQSWAIFEFTRGLSDSWRTGAWLIGLTLLGFPWLAGLVLRATAAARQSRASQEVAEQDREQALEIARLQEAQALLANDVHDVVGHSLAVILAQAESAPYLTARSPEELNDALRATMATIAQSARASLRDVRGVLTASRDQLVSVPAGGLDGLLSGIRDSGQDVRVERTGHVRALAPEREAVAYRVMQEMLTNAMRHGVRDAPIAVLQAWPEVQAPSAQQVLRIEVTNECAPDSQTSLQGGEGLGLAGMRSRVESVGGSIHAGPRQVGSVTLFVASAVIPVRSGG